MYSFNMKNGKERLERASVIFWLFFLPASLFLSTVLVLFYTFFHRFYPKFVGLLTIFGG